mgnify:FL=1
MKNQERQHLTSHRDRTRAAAMASGVLVSKREVDGPTRQALEAVMFQREERVDVLEWTRSLVIRVTDGEVAA